MEVMSNPLDILSFVCANICTNLNQAGQAKPVRRPEVSRDRRELVLYCHETLDSFFDEEEDRKTTAGEAPGTKPRRNYQLELGFKLASVSPPQKTISIIKAIQMPQSDAYPRKRKICMTEADQGQGQGPPRKMTRNNRGNLYKQIIREEIVH